MKLGVDKTNLFKHLIMDQMHSKIYDYGLVLTVCTEMLDCNNKINVHICSILMRCGLME